MEEEKMQFAADEIRKLAQLLQDMYGRIGIGAVYDTMYDRADKLEKMAHAK